MGLVHKDILTKLGGIMVYKDSASGMGRSSEITTIILIFNKNNNRTPYRYI